MDPMGHRYPPSSVELHPPKRKVDMSTDCPCGQQKPWRRHPPICVMKHGILEVPFSNYQWGKTRINHHPNLTIFMAGMVTRLPFSNGWFMIVLHHRPLVIGLIFVHTTFAPFSTGFPPSSHVSWHKSLRLQFWHLLHQPLGAFHLSVCSIFGCLCCKGCTRWCRQDS